MSDLVGNAEDRFSHDAAHLCAGGLQGGDQLLEVNGESLEGVTNDRLPDHFTYTPQTLYNTVRYNTVLDITWFIAGPQMVI